MFCWTNWFKTLVYVYLGLRSGQCKAIIYNFYHQTVQRSIITLSMFPCHLDSVLCASTVRASDTICCPTFTHFHRSQSDTIRPIVAASVHMCIIMSQCRILSQPSGKCPKISVFLSWLSLDKLTTAMRSKQLYSHSENLNLTFPFGSDNVQW